MPRRDIYEDEEDSDGFLLEERYDEEGFVVHYRLVIRSGNLLISGMQVFSPREPPPAGMTATFLDRLTPGKSLSYALRKLQSGDWIVGHRHWKPVKAVPRAIRRPRRRGRGRSLDDLFLAQVSADYVRLVRDAYPRPIKALADQYNSAQTTIQKWLWMARKLKGLLTETPEGRAGGDLTDKARSLLAGIEKGTETKRRKTTKPIAKRR